MKSMAAAVLLMMSACTQPTPCESKGGICTRTDFECTATQTFIGFDSSCGVNDKCCVPRTVVFDGGTPCESYGGTCLAAGTLCSAGLVQIQAYCAADMTDVCCAKPDAGTTVGDAGH